MTRESTFTTAYGPPSTLQGKLIMSDKKDSAVAELKVPQSVLDLAKKIRKDIKIGEGGVVEFEKNFFESTLPEDLPMSVVKRVQEHTADVISAVGLAAGQEGNAYFKKNKEAQTITGGFGIGRDDFEFQYARSKTYPGVKDRPPTTTNGVLIPKYTAAGAVASRGHLKKIKAFLSEQAANG